MTGNHHRPSIKDLNAHLPNTELNALERARVMEFTEIAEFVVDVAKAAGNVTCETTQKNGSATVSVVARESATRVAAVHLRGTDLAVTCRTPADEMRPVPLTQYGSRSGPITDLEGLKDDLHTRLETALQTWG